MCATELARGGERSDSRPPMRFLLLLLCVLQGLLMSSCRKKTSPEFYKLEAAHSILVAREGDDAFVSDEMTVILSGLQAIPEDALERPRATALAAQISAERSRVAAEKIKPPPPAPVDPFAGRPSALEPVKVEPTTAGTEEQSDAGAPGEEATQPWSGMAEKLFVARFGTCFGAPVPATLPDGKPATSYMLTSKADCQKQHGDRKSVV